MQTRLKRLDALCLGALLALAPFAAQAHGDENSAVPASQDLSLGLTVAATYLRADQALPSNQLRGFLLQGDDGIDRRGTGLEHAVADIGWRLAPQFTSYLALGKHDSDAAHIEAAWLQVQGVGDDWRLRMGRQQPALGAVMGQAGHLDRFALVPLAKRMAVNDEWTDDGVQLGWRGAVGGLPVAVDTGVWRGHVFPGAARGSMVPAVHIGAELGNFALDMFAARFQPQGRGARAVGVGGGHTHDQPKCDTPLGQVVCFDGRSHVAGASVRWADQALPVSVSAAAWLRQDRGALTSANGTGDLRANYRGGWVEGIWQLVPQWQAGVRAEHLTADQSLRGPGASLVAAEVALTDYRPSRRLSWLLGYSPMSGLDLRLEAGSETVAGTQARYTLLRAVWAIEKLF